MTVPGDADDPIDHVVAQAEQDALLAAVDDPRNPDRVRAVLAWLLAEHGPEAVLDLAEGAIFDLAEAMEVIGRTERREVRAVIDEWFHDEPLPPQAP